MSSDFPFYALTNPPSKEAEEVTYQYILHASDIHIRTGDLDKCRYEEYSSIFQEFLNSIRSFSHLDKAVLVLTGDIFHHKGKIEPAGIKLAQEFMDALLECLDVVMICGNHDYRQDNPAIPDMIETIYKNYISHRTNSKHRLYYLRQTGYYQYHNIGFTIVDVRDTLKHYNTMGRKEELDPFPSKDFWKYRKQVTYPIAMFHGTILPSKLANNLQLEDGYDLEWFGNYPYLLLGDNHRTQCHRAGETMWGYAGSLIQQDFGESYSEHGYLIWDLLNKTVEHKELFNNYSLCTFKYHKGELYLHRKQKEWAPVRTSKLPLYPTIRVFDHTTIEKVEKLCKEQQLTPRYIQYWNHEKMVVNEEDTSATENDTLWMSHLEELNTQEKWFEYISKQEQPYDLKDMILHPEQLKLPIMEQDQKKLDFLRKYTERNDKIQKSIDEYTNELGKTQKSIPRVELQHMSWAYLMCYGGTNHFDFKKLKGKIALLNGKNAMGKSSFLDIICIGLYGEPTKMRNLVNGKKYTDKIIHDQRPSNKVAPFVKILFTVGDQMYEIYRTFGTQAAKNKEHLILQTNIQIFKVISETTKEILCEGSTMVDKWITEHIGDMESILMSTMVCQVDLNNFFHLKQDEQKAILDKALRLENVSLYGKILKESILAHQDILQQLRTAMQTIENLHEKGEGSEMGEEEELVLEQVLEEVDDKLQRLEGQKTLFQQYIVSYDGKEVIPENIEELYREAEIKYHDQSREIHPEDTETYYRYKERLAMLEENYQKYLEENIPTIPKAREQYLKWKKKYDAFLKKQPKCDVSMEWMENTKADYEAWIESNQIDGFELEKEEEYKELFDTTKNALFSFHTIEKPKQEKPSYHGILISEEEYLEKLQRYKEISSPMYVPPVSSYNKEAHIAWIERYQEWMKKYEDCLSLEGGEEAVLEKCNKLEEKLQSYHEKDVELVEIKENITELEKELTSLDTLEFNPDCWACQKNPFHHKKIETQQTHQELATYCKQLKKYLEKIQQSNLPTKWQEKKEHYTQYLMSKEEFTEKVKEWEKEKKQYESWKEWKETIASLESFLEEYQQQQLSLQWEKYEYQQETKEKLTREYHEAEGTWNRFMKYKQEKLSWDQVLEKLNNYKEVYELYQVWCQEHTIIQEKLLSYQKSMEKEELEQNIMTCRSFYEELQQSVMCHLDYTKYRSMYYKQKWETMEEEYRVLLEEKQVLSNKKSSMEAQKAYIQKQRDTHTFLRELEAVYVERLQKIKMLDQLFMGDKTNSDGYKEWIYKCQVIPLLNREMNKFLQMFEHFSFEMVYDKKNFIYMLDDRGNKPTLDKASGYQNFIIGLALRIVLARIGAVGQQLKHLFIDEGFTACDSTNIEKVPILLENILKYGDYHSILMMSHLESVRESCQLNINIDRKDPFSFITYGNNYPELSIYDATTGNVIVKKQRGRPKKEKEVTQET